MCDPATAMALTTLGVGVFQNLGKQQQAKAQYAANKASAERNYRFQMKGLKERRMQESQNFTLRHQQIGLRTQDERVRTSRNILNTSRKGAVLQGKATGGIIQRGITGTTADAILRDIQRGNLEQINAAIQNGDKTAQNLQYQNFLNFKNYENLQTKLNLQEEGYGYQMDNNISSVGKPSDMSLLLGLMGTGLNTAGAYTNAGGQWGKSTTSTTPTTSTTSPSTTQKGIDESNYSYSGNIA